MAKSKKTSGGKESKKDKAGRKEKDIAPAKGGKGSKGGKDAKGDLDLLSVTALDVARSVGQEAPAADDGIALPTPDPDAPERDASSGGRPGTKGKATGAGAAGIVDALRVHPGFRLDALRGDATPGFDGDQHDAERILEDGAGEVAELQERLYAEAKGGGKRSLLLVVQGMDTSGKGGIMRHVVGLMDPQGVQITAFKAPTPQERAHPFLWRIRNALPKPGMVGVFDRSHYEDVLVVRVHDYVPPSVWSRRYGQINAFERTTTARGTRIVKVMLHISPEEQKTRLSERLARPDKHWKFNPGDLDERALWPDYQEAYQALLDKTSTDDAPWYVVPADHKWYARLAVQQVLLQALREMDPQWPAADFDVAEQQARLAES